MTEANPPQPDPPRRISPTGNRFRAHPRRRGSRSAARSARRSRRMTSSGSAQPRGCTSTRCSFPASDPLSGTLLSFRPGAILMVFEHARGANWALHRDHAGGHPGGVAVGQSGLLGPRAAWCQWAWRVPFLLSAVLIVVGITIRLKIDESPELEELKVEGRSPRTRSLRCCATPGATCCARSACVCGDSGPRRGPYVHASYVTRERLADRTTTLTALMLAAGVRVRHRDTLLWGIPLFLTVNTGAQLAIIVAFIISYAVSQHSAPACRAHGSRSCSQPRPAPAVPRWPTSSRPSSRALRR